MSTEPKRNSQGCPVGDSSDWDLAPVCGQRGAPGQVQAAHAMETATGTPENALDLWIVRQPIVFSGRYPAMAITVNGAVPGSLIHLREGQNFVVRVHNTLTEDISIHWHGLLLPAAMDGVPDRWCGGGGAVAASRMQAERREGSGLNRLMGLLRYEIRRETAPCVGLSWSRSLAGTADLARMEQVSAADWSLLTGLRLWVPHRFF